MFSLPLLLTVYAGFTHAFEADHLLAVGNLVSRRDKTSLSLKDGIFWGLGHASTIFFIGILMLLFKTAISEQYFHYFEVVVGCMLVALAVYRLVKFYRPKKLLIHTHTHLHGDALHQHIQHHSANVSKHEHGHSLAYGVGLVHGLAGSGALIVMVMSQINRPVDGLIYLTIFGAGCIGGMMLAAGLFSLPFSKKIFKAHTLQAFLIFTSSVLCLLYGTKLIYENLAA